MKAEIPKREWHFGEIFRNGVASHVTNFGTPNLQILVRISSCMWLWVSCLTSLCLRFLVCRQRPRLCLCGIQSFVKLKEMNTEPCRGGASSIIIVLIKSFFNHETLNVSSTSCKRHVSQNMLLYSGVTCPAHHICWTGLKAECYHLWKEITAA